MGLTRPVPGTNGARAWDIEIVPGTNRLSLFDYTVNHHFVPFVPGTSGFRPWCDCHVRGVSKMFMCFVFFFAP